MPLVLPRTRAAEFVFLGVGGVTAGEARGGRGRKEGEEERILIERNVNSESADYANAVPAAEGSEGVLCGAVAAGERGMEGVRVRWVAGGQGEEAGVMRWSRGRESGVLPGVAVEWQAAGDAGAHGACCWRGRVGRASQRAGVDIGRLVGAGRVF